MAGPAPRPTRRRWRSAGVAAWRLVAGSDGVGVAQPAVATLDAQLAAARVGQDGPSGVDGLGLGVGNGAGALVVRGDDLPAAVGPLLDDALVGAGHVVLTSSVLVRAADRLLC